MTTRAIIFDFGKVICDFDIGIFLQKAARYSKRKPEELPLIIRQATGLAIQFETGLITSDDFFTGISSMAGLSMPREAFIEAYTQIFTPIPSTVALIKALKPRYLLGLLSNTNEWHFEYGIKKVDVFPLFDAVTLSYQVKAMKPALPIYTDMLAKLHAEPGECVYIDDIKENADAGAAIGMHAIHYVGYGELAARLKEFQVTIE